MMLLIDGSGGVDGERLLAAFVDAGLPVAWLRRVLVRLPEPPTSISAQRVVGGGTAVTFCWRTRWSLTPQPASAVRHSLTRCGLPPMVTRTALTILQRLIWAEARAHRCAPERVRLHQVGSPRALTRLVGVSAALAYFRVRAVYTTPLLIGARSQDHGGHWRRRVAPAVSGLMAGWPTLRSTQSVEYTTPTGAAIVTALARKPWSGLRSPEPLGRPGLPRGVMRIVAQGTGRRADDAALATRIFLIDRVLRIQ